MAIITNLFAVKADGTYYTSGSYHTQGVYTVEHSSSSSTVYVWQLGNSSWGGLLADHTFSYNTSTKVWSDVGSSNPVEVCDGSSYANTTSTSSNPQTLSFWQSSSSKLFELANPYYSTSTSTESLTNSGSFSLDGSGLRWLISAVSGDGDYYITKTDAAGVVTTVDTITISGSGYLGFTIRTGLVSSFDSQYTYKLLDPAEVLLDTYASSSSSSSSSKKKVHSNFW